MSIPLDPFDQLDDIEQICNSNLCGGEAIDMADLTLELFRLRESLKEARTREKAKQKEKEIKETFLASVKEADIARQRVEELQAKHGPLLRGVAQKANVEDKGSERSSISQEITLPGMIVGVGFSRRLGQATTRWETSLLPPADTEKRGRGRPEGGKTEAEDIQTYREWKASGKSKAEFVASNSLPADALLAIDRGRKLVKKNEKGPGNI